MPRVYNVEWTARFRTTITVEDNENVCDVAADIDIPEGEDTTYISDSFEVEEITDEGGNEVPL